MPAPTLESLMPQLSPVQRLVHLAGRMDAIDIEELRVALLRQRRLAYEEELEAQAARLGCPGKRARLGEGRILAELNDECRRDAEGIAATYNRDLAVAIIRIRQEAPRANRYVYARRLFTADDSWENKRAAWKGPQIAGWTVGTARSKAQADFQQRNAPAGYAVLRPREAVCPVCAGLVARGRVPLNVASNNSPPFHVGCPHGWVRTMNKFTEDECALLWLGGE